MDSVDVEAADEPRRVRGDDASGGVCQLQTSLVVVEPLRVTGDARELQDPLRLGRSRLERAGRRSG